MRSALITGCSTGIGRATALRLDGRGWRVFAGVRKQEDADSLAAAGSERLVPLIVDVADAASIELALAWRSDDADPSVLGVLAALEAAGLFPDTAPTHEATR